MSAGPSGVLQRVDTAHDITPCQDNCDVQRAPNADVQHAPAEEVHRERAEERLRTNSSYDELLLCFIFQRSRRLFSFP